jgi:hypothetical protein
MGGFMNSTLVSGLVSNGPGYLQIPSVNFDGSCNDNNYAQFEDSVSFSSNKEDDASSTCLRTLSSEYDEFYNQCMYQFSVQRYVTDLWIAK